MASSSSNAPYDQERDGPRLFLVDGQPTLTREQQRFLGESERMIRNTTIARDLLTDGVALDDPEKCLKAARSLFHIGLYLTDLASAAS